MIWDISRCDSSSPNQNDNSLLVSQQTIVVHSQWTSLKDSGFRLESSLEADSRFSGGEQPRISVGDGKKFVSLVQIPLLRQRRRV